MPVVYGKLPELQAGLPLRRRDQAQASGLRLYETFVEKAEFELGRRSVDR